LIGLPVVSIGRDAQDNTDDREDRDEAGPRQDLIIQTEAVVIPFAIIGPVQFQGSAAMATKSALYERPERKRGAMTNGIITALACSKTSIRRRSICRVITVQIAYNSFTRILLVSWITKNYSRQFFQNI